MRYQSDQRTKQTSYERTRGCRYESALVPFGEVVMAKIADAERMRAGKLDSAWVKAVWVGRVHRSNEERTRKIRRQWESQEMPPFLGTKHPVLVVNILAPCQPCNHSVIQEDLSGLWKEEKDRTLSRLVATLGLTNFVASWNSSKHSSPGKQLLWTADRTLLRQILRMVSEFCTSSHLFFLKCS